MGGMGSLQSTYGACCGGTREEEKASEVPRLSCSSSATATTNGALERLSRTSPRKSIERYSLQRPPPDPVDDGLDGATSAADLGDSPRSRQGLHRSLSRKATELAQGVQRAGSALVEAVAWTDHASGTEDEQELGEEPLEFPCRGHRGAVSSEAYGMINQRRATYTPPNAVKSKQQADKLRDTLRQCWRFGSMEADALDGVVRAMPVTRHKTGSCVFQQNDDGDSVFVVLSGSVGCYIPSVPAAARHSPRRFRDKVASSCVSRVSVVPRDRACGSNAHPDRGTCVRIIPNEKGTIFGELAMFWGVPRTLSVYVEEACELAELKRDVYQNLVQRWAMRERERKDSCLRKVKLLETMSDEQLATIGDSLEKRVYKKGEHVISQGDQGKEFYIVLEGECFATVETGGVLGKKDVQEHRSYGAGELFGERAFLKRNVKRAANVIARDRCEVLVLSRAKFERLMGTLDHVQKSQYNTDPRMNIALFYQTGDSRGPRGVYKDPLQGDKSDWFAVYRPTSRDAMAKMLGGVAVGKGLNVKGKSAKRNRLSGFVPFLQISDNDHKEMIEASPPDARFRIYYASEDARQTCLARLTPFLESDELDIDERRIMEIDKFQGIFGLEAPEAVIRQAYIMEQDITFLVGWDTGRKSEPAFMDMNLHAVRRDDVEPRVVLFQQDKDNPMNPHGLLIAYAENGVVKPVVSDFDTFTVGSRNMKYDPLPSHQVELATWSLDRTWGILAKPSARSWTTRWLEVLKRADEDNFHPELPRYGYGDATSYGLIADVVHATRQTGAVRHGAESFNFHFPQELDEEYLVVWDGFSSEKPWDYMDQDALREWLLDRVSDGYSFPLNPVWPVRDEGWYDIWEALRDRPREENAAFNCWYPPESSIVSKVEEIHRQFPAGFSPVVDILHVQSEGGTLRLEPAQRQTLLGDADTAEHAELLYEQIRRPVLQRQAKVRRSRTFSDPVASSTAPSLRSTLRSNTALSRLSRINTTGSMGTEEVRPTKTTSSPAKRRTVVFVEEVRDGGGSDDAASTSDRSSLFDGDGGGVRSAAVAKIPKLRPALTSNGSTSNGSGGAT